LSDKSLIFGNELEKYIYFHNKKKLSNINFDNQKKTH
jgi:hypothetical protein